MKTKHIIIFALLCGGAFANDKMPADVMLAQEPPKVTFTGTGPLTDVITNEQLECEALFNAVDVSYWLKITGKPIVNGDRAITLCGAGRIFDPEHVKIVSKKEPRVTKGENGEWVIDFPEREAAAPVAKPESEAEKLYGPSPSAEFIDGFEKGVRYGLIAKMNKPDEDSIAELTKEAIKLYALIGRGGMIKIMEEEKKIEPTTPQLITLEQHEMQRPILSQITEARNGIACPKCGEELWDDLTRVMTSNPPQTPVSCKKCGYSGSRH